MAGRERLGSLQYLVLLAVRRLRENVYAETVRKNIEDATGTFLSTGSVYGTLTRLERKKYLSSWIGDSTGERGGKAKRFYAIEPAGIAALESSNREMASMNAGGFGGVLPK